MLFITKKMKMNPQIPVTKTNGYSIHFDYIPGNNRNIM